MYLKNSFLLFLLVPGILKALLQIKVNHAYRVIDPT